ALEPLIKETGGVWVAWGGRLAEETSEEIRSSEPGLLVTNGCQEPLDGLRLEVPFDNPSYTLREVLLTDREVEGFYHGLANGCLWPLCHSFLEKCNYNPDEWVKYVEVNRKFARTVIEEAKEGDLIWVQDYHLALVPQWIRRWQPSARIAMFWHIPFPPYEVFSTLPWARQILLGLLGCDLLAFHLESYKENFLKCLRRYFGLEAQDGYLNWGNHTLAVQAVPIGIDYREFEKTAEKPEVRQRAKEIREILDTDYVLFGIERLDYTKGILERLRALEIFLERYPAYQGRVTLIQVAVPSREDVPAYQALKRQVEEAVGRINGRFARNWQVPVRYLYGSLSQEDLVAHYLACDLALVTPLRDGLNLVAKEFVASRVDKRGMLLLSPFAGAAAELTEALLVNPYAPGEVAVAIKQGLTMPIGELEKRLTKMQNRIKQKDAKWWWQQMKTYFPLPVRRSGSTRSETPKLLELEQAKGRKSGSNTR
ncbi:MAG: alpha,alpha-trehalose-phosphate synthase (UDP-forming), partial [Thermincolia bacterium]